MSVILKDASNVTIYTFPSGTELIAAPFSKRLDAAPRVYQHGAVLVGDEKVEPRMVTVHGIFGKASQALMETELNSMKKACYTKNLRLYATQYANDFYFVEVLSFDHIFHGQIPVVEISIEFQCTDPFRYYKDSTTDTHYLSKALSLDGNGYASIADGSQTGLDMGLSDFMLEMRVKLTVPSASQPDIFAYLFSKYTAGETFYEAWLSKDDETIGFVIFDTVNNAYLWSSSSYLDDLEWHSLVFVADRNQVTGLELYVDSVEVAYDAQTDPTSVGDLDNTGEFTVGAAATIHTEKLISKIDEVRVWNFGVDGLPVDYATYIAWRYANPFAPTSEYGGGSWNCYADAVQTDLHDGAGTVTGLVVGEKYGYVTATPHTLDYQGGTLDDDGVFTATHTTGTIADGDADDHVRRVGLVARYKFEGDYTDEGSNSNHLTEGGTGNSFPLYVDSGTVSNGGDVEVHPIITFTAGGTITNVKVENAQDGGKYFNYSGLLVLDDVLEVDCQKGTVKKNGVDDIANFADSFIKLASGDNAITVTITGTPADSNLKFEFRERYL